MDDDPWTPEFDVTKVVQELRDEIYPDTKHSIDSKSPVCKLVSLDALHA
jgi:hypothetical protein